MDLSEDSRMLMFAPEQTRVRLMDPQQVPLLNEVRKDLFRFDCQWNDQASRFFSNYSFQKFSKLWSLAKINL